MCPKPCTTSSHLKRVSQIYKNIHGTAPSAPHTRPTQRLSRSPPIQKLGAENHMLQLNVWSSWRWAYVPETCRAKNTLIKSPCCIKLAFQITSQDVFKLVNYNHHGVLLAVGTANRRGGEKRVSVPWISHQWTAARRKYTIPVTAEWPLLSESRWNTS